MANYATLKAAIRAVIKTNGNNEITGSILQQTLLAVVESLGVNYQFVGVATTSTNPGTPDQNVAYLGTPGTYPNFGSLVIPDGNLGVLKYNGSWAVETMRCDEQVVNYLAQIFENGNIKFGPKTIAQSGGTGQLDIMFPLLAGSTVIISVTPSGGASNMRIYGLASDGTATGLTNYSNIPSGTQHDFELTISNDYAGFRLYQSSQSTATSIVAVLKVPSANYVTSAQLNAALANYAPKNSVVASFKNWFDSDVMNIDGFVRPNGTESTSNLYRKSDYLPISGATKIKIHCNLASVAVAPVVFYDSNKNYISGYTATSTGVQDFNIDVPANAAYIKVSNSPQYLDIWTCDVDFYAAKYLENNAGRSMSVFISPNGNDSNDGLTRETPFATFSEAKNRLQDGGVLYLCPGDYENPDFSIDKFPRVIGIGKVRFLYPLHKITSASLVSGYTRVYSAQFTKSGLMNYTYFLYQHDIPDPDSAIPTSEMHPLQKGASYRVPSTRIYKVDSIAAIESTTDRLCWYYDNGTVYFSKTADSNLATNPIVIPGNVVITASNFEDVEIANLNILYGKIQLTKVNGVFNGVSCGMGALGAGQVMCDYCKDLKFESCEFYCAHTNQGGDGVNTHNNDTSVSDRSKIELRDCWLHDNGDDGESCHENSLSIHHGGLIEYNGNGITPAAGGASICYNVVVRNNGIYKWAQDPGGTGFSAQGGTMECIGCLSEGNRLGFTKSGSSPNFVAINCVAKNNTVTNFENVTQYNCAIIQ